MSVQFTSNTHVCGIDSNNAISHRAFTITCKAYLDSDTAGAAISLETTSSQYHELYWAGSATGWRVGVNYRNATNSRTIGTSATGVWVSVALVGTVNGSDQSELRGLIQPPGGSVSAITAPNPQYNDTLDNIHISAADTTLGTWFRGKIADVKLWSRALSDAEVEAEFASQAAVSTTNLICANYFDGGSISAALSSNVSNAAYADTWSNLDYAGVARSNPVYSADAPTYASGSAPTLSGAWTMPDTVPAAPGIGTVQSAIASVESGASVSVTLPNAPEPDDVLVVKVSGFMQTATTIAITDNQRVGSPLGPNTYTQRILQQGTGAGAQMWAGIWTLRVPSDAVAPFTVTATPNAASNWISISVEEVDEVDVVTPVIGTPTGANGASNAPSVNLASVASAPALITAVATSLNSTAAWSAVANWTQVRTRSGTAALASIERRVATTGDYDPTWALSFSDSWAAAAVVLAESGGAVAPTITTTSLPAAVPGVPYSQTLAATGSAPITWAIQSGALPTGLGLAVALGTITGTPIAGATSQTFTLRAENSTGNDTQELTITVGAAPSVTTASLASGTVGTAYSQTLAATGASPITWATMGALPPGLTRSGATISGTPTSAGTWQITATATNDYGASSRVLTISIAEAAVVTKRVSPWARWIRK
ncbi:MAG: hypothetical protein RL756_2311 [Pseudomonadota bacterium]|jgi:hypothetical protein